jgi:hypothetical protein
MTTYISSKYKQMPGLEKNEQFFHLNPNTTTDILTIKQYIGR